MARRVPGGLTPGELGSIVSLPGTPVFDTLFLRGDAWYDFEIQAYVGIVGGNQVRLGETLDEAEQYLATYL